MRSINPKCHDKDSFKYSILAWLHYYDINNHAEKISKLQPFFCNPNASLKVYDEIKNVLYESCKNTRNKATIVKIISYRYAAIKPKKNNYVKLKEVIAYIINVKSCMMIS